MGALELDAGFWWELPRVLRHLRRSGNEVNLLERNRPELEVLLRAAVQRSDTQDLAAEILKKLEGRDSGGLDLSQVSMDERAGVGAV